ncbi:MAG: ComEC/Rec2 family competence protein [Actinomycetaceae bacterium]|nr:ComEC/Rec2 family competence protein [Actinomycetaceae bacterium]
MAGQDYRLLPLALSMLGGAAAALHFGASGSRAVGPLLLAVGIALIGARRRRVRDGQREDESGGGGRAGERATPGLLAACLVGVTSGWWVACEHVSHATDEAIVAAAEAGKHARLRGTVTARPRTLGETCVNEVRPLSLEAGGSSLPVSPRLRIRVWKGDCAALVGQEVAVAGTLRASTAAERTAASINARQVEISGEGTPLARMVSAVDRALAERLEGLPSHARGLVPGVALGDTAKISSDLEVAMRLTQLTHLIAVSGGHVSILLAIVVVLVGRRNVLVTAGLACLLVCGLVVLVGPEASVMRAVGMAAVVFAALARGRSTQAVASLSIAIIAVTAIDPWLATSYGFLLSASATLGIVVFGGPLADHLTSRVPRMPRLLAEALAIPLAAQLSCLPVLALFTDTGSVWGVLANALVAPVVAPLTVSGLGAAVLAPFAPVLASILLVPAAMCTWWIDRVALTLAHWPGSGISLLATAAACLALLAVMIALRKRAVALVTLALLAFGAWSQRGQGADIPDDWDIVQCDVGQGAGLLVRVHGLTAMVDVGPEGDRAARCLRSAGVKRVDILVLTHAHSDHIGGIPAVLEEAEVGEVWVSPNMAPRANEQWLSGQLKERGIEPVTVHRGYEALGTDGQTALHVLWPRADAPQGDEEANAQSIALRVDIPGGLLAMGDQDESAQSRFASQVADVRVMLVSHHGSADQSRRLAANTDPDIALISVGENTYGHPSKKVMDMYAAADIYDTLACGTIVVRGSEVTSQCDGPVG